ncbi:MAG: M23 family metallopeptidase [Elusimicrobia bacterium]|nr:M23 family metallopeptidase [Elusimicrobiota bacterium]MDE2237891.1 M23 family metallopeptidase [Elusimicrobiota bacterium]MDE2425888.1 M23 family metallopeptidase [Elusimicrobiota bacterium]
MRPRLLLAAALVGLAAAAAPRVKAQWIAPQEWLRFSVLTAAGPAEPPPAILRALRHVAWAQHRIVRGEWSAVNLARKYGTTKASLQATNHDELYIMPIGRRLTVLNKPGELYTVRRDGETLSRIALRFCPSGASRRAACEENLVLANDLPGAALLNDYEFSKGDRLLIPHFRVPRFDSFHFPLRGAIRITSGFGMRYHPLLHRRRFHDGFDIAKPYGTPVFPARSGRVIQTGWVEGYGMLIVIRHSDGWTTRYGHLSKIFVHPGQLVERGRTMIGRVGSTGLSTGPHLHFEVRDRHNRPINPGRMIGRG